MKVTVGKEGLNKTFQDDFPEITPCLRCGGECRIAFVACEADGGDPIPLICSLHNNEYSQGNAWLHDCCAVAVYFCRKCLSPMALYNQG